MWSSVFLRDEFMNYNGHVVGWGSGELGTKRDLSQHLKQFPYLYTKQRR